MELIFNPPGEKDLTILLLNGTWLRQMIRHLKLIIYRFSSPCFPPCIIYLPPEVEPESKRTGSSTEY